MKILLFFSISFFFDVFIPPVGSRSVGNSVPPSKVPCLLKLEKLYSETRNSSTIFENAQYGTEEKQKAGSKKHYALFNLTRACIMFGGHCKNKCGENEFRMVYCDVSTSLCCIRQCKPKKYK